ncbi:MAG TPA: very short patch repair endonuclease [Thermoleophilaceae bacterium]|nr:very short patch repair endonuclease [Thermoleophilaceae bacterium]
MRTRMRANRSSDTAPELALRSALHRRGLRYRVHLRIAVAGGRPIRADIAFPRQRVAIFVDGCFWHDCPEHGELPQANREFWRTKFRRNVERDRRHDRLLRATGWQVVRVWEHESAEQGVAAVLAALNRR